MKQFAVLAALIAVGLAADEVAKPLTYTLPYAAGLPLTYGNYAGLYHPYAYAAHAPVTYTAPVTTVAAAPVEVKAAPVEIKATPVTYAAAPVAAPLTYAAAYAPAYAPSSQYQAQDEFGNLQYGYANINSAKTETGNTYAGVTGGYSYVDANNKLQTVNYVADGLGFRVADSRLPVAPVYDGVAPTFNPEPLVAPVFDGVAPEPVVDTPEVAEAKAAHLAAVEAAKAERKRRSADPAVLAASTRVLTAPTPLIHNAPVLAANYGYNYPLNYGYAGYTGLPFYGRYYL